MKWTLVATLLTILLSPLSVLAEEATGETPGVVQTFLNRASLTGSIRAGYWSSSRSLDDRDHLATAPLWLKATPTLSQTISLFVEGWIMNQQLFRKDETEAKLREAYLDVSLGPVDLRIGRQPIIWGRADQVNPTDNLTPRDFTRLVPQDDDQRIGADAVKATYYVKGFSLTGIGFFHFEPHTIPIQQPTPPLTLHEETPDEGFRQGAIRIESTGGAVDWSLSYFNGFDLFPDIGFAPSIELVLQHHRIQVIGADGTTTLGRYGLRGEAAYTFTEDTDGNDPLVKNPFFFLVLGGDRTFFEYLNVNLQYLLRVVSHYRNPEEIPDPSLRAVAIQQAVITNQLDRVQQGATLRVSHKWFNETLEGEIAGMLFFNRHDYLVRPKITYAFTDHFKGIVGGDLFRGPKDSYLGYLKDNSTLYAEIRYSF